MIDQITCVVSGLVQGVGFRYFVYRKATESGLTGWVKNLADGSVELQAQGPRDRLEILLGQVRQGPRSAMVSDVRVEWGGIVTGFDSFSIR